MVGTKGGEASHVNQLFFFGGGYCNFISITAD